MEVWELKTQPRLPNKDKNWFNYQVFVKDFRPIDVGPQTDSSFPDLQSNKKSDEAFMQLPKTFFLTAFNPSIGTVNLFSLVCVWQNSLFSGIFKHQNVFVFDSCNWV